MLNPGAENHLLGLISGPASLACTSASQPCCSSTDSIREGEGERMNEGRRSGALGSPRHSRELSGLEWSPSLLATQRAPFMQLLGESGLDGSSPDLSFLRATTCRRMCAGLYRVKMPCTPTFASTLPIRQTSSGQSEAAHEPFQHLPFALPHFAMEGVALGFQVHLLTYTQQPHRSESLTVLRSILELSEHVHSVEKNPLMPS